MILLLQDTTNNVSLTLNEKTGLTGATVYYLFELEKKDTNQIKLFTAEDISTCSNRFNLFEITLTGSTSENLTGGTISLDAGQYNYKVYSMTGQTNLDVSATTKTVETGLAYVSAITSTVITYLTDNSESKTYL